MWHKISPLLSFDPFLSSYTCLSLEWALTRLQASQLAESITRTYGRSRSTIPHTRTPSSITIHTCPTFGVMHWARPRGRPQHWYVKEARTSSQDTSTTLYLQRQTNMMWSVDRRHEMSDIERPDPSISNISN